MSTPVPPRRTLRRRVVLGGLVAVAIVAVLVVLVDGRAVLAAIQSAPPTYLLGVLVAAALWLIAWGLSLYVIMRTLSVPISRSRAIAAYASVVFANNVTPFAQFGGEALSAYVVSRSTDADYETSLAAIAGVDVLNMVPSLGFVLAGVAYLTASATVSPGVERATWVAVGIGVAAAGTGVLAWRHRRGLARRLAVVVVVVSGFAAGAFPSLPRLSTAGVAGRLDRFVDGLERLAGDRLAVGKCLVLASVGWALLVASLWLSLAAVGHPTPAGILLFVVPASQLAAIVPSPGGTGGIEAALVVLLVTAAGVPAAAATAAAIVHRAATYLLPVLVGGVATVLLRPRRDPDS